MTESSLTLDGILSARLQVSDAVVDVEEPVVKLVIFTLDEDWFAFPGDKIREILGDSPVYFLPGCPPSLEGVINLRGDIESVLRLRSVLGHGEAPAAAASAILLGQASSMRSGLRVDRVEDVVDVPQSSLQPPIHTIPDNLRPIVLGVLTFRDHLVTVLDLARIFDDYRQGLR